MVIIGILYGTFHIHKSKRCNSKPCFNAFMADFLMLNDSVKCPDNKESKYKMMLAEKLKLRANTFHRCLSSLFFLFVCLFFVWLVCLWFVLM